MILEAFQAAIARHADAIVVMLIGGFALMAASSVMAIGEIIRKRRPGHQPSSAGERPEPPRSGSGVQPPVDHLPRIARLRAELESLIYAAQGGNADRDNPAMLVWFAERCVNGYGEHPNVDFVQALRTRATMLEDALKNARDTLEATKPPPADHGLRKPSGTL